MIKPVVDFLVVGHPAQSLSTKTPMSGVKSGVDRTVGRM